MALRDTPGMCLLVFDRRHSFHTPTLPSTNQTMGKHRIEL